MRVLMLSLDRGLLGAGGSGDVVARHKKYADLAGRLDVIVFASNKYKETAIAPNLRVMPTRSSRLGHFRKAADMALALNKQHPYDLLVTQDFTAPAGLRLKKHLGLPWIVNIHSMFFSRLWLGFNPVYWYLYVLIKRAINSADGFRVNNEEIRDRLVKWGIKKPIIIQPTPIDIEKFKNNGSRIKNKGESEIKVLYVGRLEPEKNVAMLIRAFMNLKGDYALWVVGQGSLAAELALLGAPDRRIQFLGPKMLEELPEIYEEADVFVLPSHTESFGQVLLQAAASGCAIIATDTPGARTVLEGGESGILVPVNSQKALEKALQNFLSKRFEREYWAQKARERAERYDAAAGIERTIIFWKEIAVTSPQPSPRLGKEEGSA